MKTNIQNDEIWTLDFEQDGTEDVAIILDEDGEELVRSRAFWLPEGDDPVPPTLAAVRLMVVAPTMVAVLKLALTALNKAPKFRVGETTSYAIASLIERTLKDGVEG